VAGGEWRAVPWRKNDFVAWGSALGGAVTWLGVVASAALNYRRGSVPLIWWVLCVIVLVTFLALGGSTPRTSTRDRVLFTILTVSAVAACGVWGAELMSGVLLVLVAGVAGWVVPPKVSIPLMLAMTAILAYFMWIADSTVVWALLYGSLLFFASLMVSVVVREQAARRIAATVAAELEVANARLLGANDALRDAHSRLAEASKAEERLRISRDLHDGMGNQLTALSLQLDLIGRLVDGAAVTHLDQAKALTTELIRDTRGVVSQLRDTRVSPRDKIARLARSMPRPQTSLDLTEALDEVPEPVAETVVRLVQEGLTNAARHADAEHAWVVVSCAPDGLRLQVRDDGRGAPTLVPGNGLSGMAERVALLGGDLTWSSPSSGGFIVTASIPVTQASPDTPVEAAGPDVPDTHNTGSPMSDSVVG
jgi:signal transduction histidine kinase